MRLYSFVNALYLREVQWGIQTHHASEEIYQKYINSNPSLAKMRIDWGKNHKTIIILNGGNCWELSLIVNKLKEYTSNYPWAYFKEDSDSLNNALTCVSIVVPENIYNVKQKEFMELKDIKSTHVSKYYIENKDGSKIDQFLSPEEEFVFELIKSKPLAR